MQTKSKIKINKIKYHKKAELNDLSERKEGKRVRKNAKKQFIAVTHTRQKLKIERRGRGEVAKGIEELSRLRSGQGAPSGV